MTDKEPVFNELKIAKPETIPGTIAGIAKPKKLILEFPFAREASTRQ